MEQETKKQGVSTFMKVGLGLVVLFVIILLINIPNMIGNAWTDERLRQEAIHIMDREALQEGETAEYSEPTFTTVEEMNDVENGYRVTGMVIVRDEWSEWAYNFDVKMVVGKEGVLNWEYQFTP